MGSLEQAALLAENLAFFSRQKALESEATRANQQQHLIEEAPNALPKLKIAYGSGPIGGGGGGGEQRGRRTL